MVWTTDPNHPFAGIAEKLKRADENVVNLNSEIIAFFESCEYPVVPQIGDKRLLDFIHYHKALDIPARFSVLSGEIVHHLRSILDHLVWIYSDDVTRGNAKTARYLEFPILEKRPLRKNRATLLLRKVKGIGKRRILKLILQLQPYRSLDLANDPLLLIHQMDITDKHKELFICNSTGYVELPPDLADQFVRYLEGSAGRMTPEFITQFNHYGKPSLQIAFRDFGGGTVKPVVPTLTQLTNHIRDVVVEFASV